MSDLTTLALVLLVVIILAYRLIGKFAPQRTKPSIADNAILKLPKYPRWLIAFLADAIFDGKWTTFTICGITIRFDDQEPPNFYYLVEDMMSGNRWYKLTHAKLASFTYDAYQQKRLAQPAAQQMIAPAQVALIQVSNRDAEQYVLDGTSFTAADSANFKLPKKYQFTGKGNGNYVVTRK